MWAKAAGTEGKCMRELKKQAVLRWDELAFILAVETGLFIFGEIMLAVIASQTDQDETLVPLGTLAAVMGCFVIMLTMGMTSLALCFNIGVGMGSVRRRLVPMYLFFSYAEFLVMAAVAFVLHLFERFVLHTAFPDRINEFDMGFLFQWKYIWVSGFVMVGLIGLMGATFLKYGKIAFVILWVLCVACAGGISRISKFVCAAKQSDSAVGRILRRIIEFFIEMPENGLLAGLLVISALMLALSWLMIRKKQVDL